MTEPDVRDGRLGDLLEGAVRDVVPEGDVRRVLRRGALRRALPIAAAVVTAVAFVAVALSAATIVGDRRQDDRPLGENVERYAVFERTAEVGGISITSPSDWYMIDQGFGGARSEDELAPGTALPIAQLTNFDPGLDEPVCGNEVPATGAVLSIQLELVEGDAGGRDATWPKPLSEVRSSACGPGRIARFSASSESTWPPFLLWVAFGDDVSEGDRATLLEAVDSLIVSDRENPLFGAEPAYVLTGGTNGSDEPWLLEVRPTDVNAEVELLTGDGASGVGDFTVPSTPIEGTRFGAVTKEARGVEFRPRSGDPAISATLVRPPPSLELDADIFFFADLLPGELPAGDVVAVGVGDDGVPRPSPFDALVREEGVLVINLQRPEDGRSDPPGRRNAR